MALVRGRVVHMEESTGRSALVRAANRLASEARRGGAPKLTESSSREEVVDWLQWNDPNGSHTDELADREDFDRYTEARAWKTLDEMIDE